MEKRILPLLLLFILVTSACKKDKPAPPEPDFMGCKIANTSIVTGVKRSGGTAYYYQNNQLYSRHNTDTFGTIDTASYYRFKFSGNQLAEHFRVNKGSVSEKRVFEYDEKGRVSLMKYFGTSNTNRFIAYRFYYNNNEWCYAILGGLVQIINGSGISEKTDSVAFKDFTSTGNPKIIEWYRFSDFEPLQLNERTRFEYDAYNNIIKEYYGITERLMYEYEYDITLPYNKEYVELQEALIWSKYLTSYRGLLPIQQIGKYPKSKITYFENNGGTIISRFENKFDNNGRYVSQTLYYQYNEPRIITYTYTCK